MDNFGRNYPSIDMAIIIQRQWLQLALNDEIPTVGDAGQQVLKARILNLLVDRQLPVEDAI
eukprot:scaffold2575_cov158-Chaetoceros_neogracile.AAC.2